MAGEVQNFTYDALDRFVNVTQTGGVRNGVPATYQFDTAGNRQLVAVIGGQTQPARQVVVLPVIGFLIFFVSRTSYQLKFLPIVLATIENVALGEIKMALFSTYKHLATLFRIFAAMSLFSTTQLCHAQVGPRPDQVVSLPNTQVGPEADFTREPMFLHPDMRPEAAEIQNMTGRGGSTLKPTPTQAGCRRCGEMAPTIDKTKMLEPSKRPGASPVSVARDDGKREMPRPDQVR